MSTVPASSEAQDTLSFSTLELSAGASTVLDRGALGDAWRSTPGVLFSASTPYGPGRLRLSFEATRRGALRADAPDYVAIFPSLEWGLARRLVGPLSGVATAGLGGLWMRFEDVTNPTEVELGLIATLQLRSALAGPWTVGGGVSVRRILLSQPVNEPLAFVSIGFRMGVGSALRRALIASESSNGDSTQDTAVVGGPDMTSQTRPAVVTRADLSDRGVQRLSETFAAFPGWDRATVDHRAVWATPDGLSPTLGPGPHLLIDGIPVATPRLGGTTLDLLPISLEDVDAVSASGQPGMSDGRFYDRGQVRYRTHRPDSDGPSAFATVLAENAIGDPGPFLYLDSTAANVDKVGTGYDVGARWRSGSFSASGGFRYSSDIVTGRRLGGRTLSLRDPRVEYPVVRTRAPWLSVRIDEARTSHLLRAGRAERSDYLFLPALGFEVPTNVELTHVGGAGQLALSPRLSWSYDAHGTWIDLAPSSNDLGLAFDLGTRVVGAQSGIVLTIDRGRLAAGLGIDRERNESPMLDSPVASRSERSWISADARVGRSEVGVDAEIGRTNGAWGSRWKLRGASVLTPAVSLDWSVWHLRAAPTEVDGFWGLHERGYRFLAEADVEVRVGPALPRIQSGAHLALAGVVGSALTVTPFARVARMKGLTIERYSFAPGVRRPAHDGVVHVSHSGPGDVLSAGVEARWQASRSVDVEVRYRWLDALDGDTLITASWEAFPVHRFLQSVRWVPRPDLRIGMSGELSSGTRWVGFEGLGVDRLPGIVQVDAWVEKSFWSRRISVRGRLLDLLNRQNALHPLGAAPGLRAALWAGVHLGH